MGTRTKLTRNEISTNHVKSKGTEKGADEL